MGDDFSKRVAKLRGDNSGSIPSDDVLAQRFENIFAKKPVASSRTYNLPQNLDTPNDDEIDQLLAESQLLDDDDLLDDVLGDPHLRNDISQSGSATWSQLKATEALFTRDDPSVDPDATDALIQRLREEAALEKQYDSFAKARDEDLEKRYMALRNNNPVTLSTTTPSSGKAPGRIPRPLAEDEVYDEMEDWCCICNEDATLVCDGCDGEKYCDACFYEGHRGDMADYESTKHTAKKWVKRQNRS